MGIFRRQIKTRASPKPPMPWIETADQQSIQDGLHLRQEPARWKGIFIAIPLGQTPTSTPRAATTRHVQQHSGRVAHPPVGHLSCLPARSSGGSTGRLARTHPRHRRGRGQRDPAQPSDGGIQANRVVGFWPWSAPLEKASGCPPNRVNPSDSSPLAPRRDVGRLQPGHADNATGAHPAECFGHAHALIVSAATGPLACWR
jgi:hypothetical protein